MSRILAISTILCWASGWALADTIRDATVLSAKEIEGLPEVLEPRMISISTIQLQSIEAMLRRENGVSSRDVLRSLARRDPNKIPVMELSLVLGDLPIASEFADHSDPVVRFIANVYLLKAGRLDASERLYTLIHDKQLSRFDARYLRTRFAAIGIDVQNATALQIAQHFSKLAREFPFLSIGSEVPDARFTDTNGRTYSLSDFRGKTVVIHYWATWCGPCMDEIDSVADRLSTLKENQSVVLFVSLDFDLESHAKRIEKLPKNVLYTCDGQSAHGQLASLFAVIHLPANVVISPDGKLLSTSLSDIFPMDQKDKTR